MRRTGPVGPTRRAATHARISDNVASWVPAHEATSRILASWARAEGTDHETTGRAFYPLWHEAARDLAAAYHVPTLYGSAAIAALSPRMPAPANLLAAHALTAGDWALTSVLWPPLLTALEKAWAILCEQRPDAIGWGSKTRSFALNIGRPDKPGPITLDVWSMTTLYGRHLTDRDLKPLLERRGGYVWHTGPFRAAARRLGELPHVVQSVTWHETRAAHGADWRDALLAAADAAGGF